MLYIHSNHIIEQTIFNHLRARIIAFQLLNHEIDQAKSIEDSMEFKSCQTILYSSLSFEHYKFIDSFELECKRVDAMIEFAISNGVEKCIVLSYPGAFVNSDNLFLKYKGILEQKFHESRLHITYLNVQAVVNPYQRNHSLHKLFYNTSENKYIIPKKSNMLVYSVMLNTLVDIITEAHLNAHHGHFDVFDQVDDLSSFLQIYSRNIPLERISPTYLFVKSYFGTYISPTMMELFLRTSVPMYSYRTEKEFGVDLKADKPGGGEYFENADYKVSPVFGTKGYRLST